MKLGPLGHPDEGTECMQFSLYDLLTIGEKTIGRRDLLRLKFSLYDLLTYHLRSRRPMGARLMTFGLLTVGAYHLLTYGEKLGDLRSPGLR